MDPPFSNLSEIWPEPMTRPGLGQFFDHSEALGTGRSPTYSDGGPGKRRENGDDNDLNAKGLCNAMSNINGKSCKTSVSADNIQNSKASESEQKSKAPSTEPPKDYIHVRARRGQATDSHSLAERARREKISERMRILQDLVPGCNKVIGKALVLDEIINYIQSLQRQVEFLSMKLEAVNSGIEAFPVKDIGQQAFDTSGVVYVSQTTPREYDRDTSHEWLHMQIGGSGFDRQS